MLKKRKIILSAGILIPFLLTNILKAQSHSYEALKKGGWTGGLAGIVGWNNFDEQRGDTASFEIDGFRFVLDSRNGKIVENNIAFGFDIHWDETTRTTIPKDNLSNSSNYQKQWLYFVGLWFRYYLTSGSSNWVLFPEASAGYANFKNVDEFKDDILPNTKSVNSADGFAYNVGIGVAHFLSPTVSFDVTVRWQRGKLSGDFVNASGVKNKFELNLSNIIVLFGFQIYLR